MNSIKIGLKNEKFLKVEFKDTAAALGHEDASVFSTPAMISLMELTSLELLEKTLDEGETSLGISIDIKHLAATPVGSIVRCEAELIEVVKSVFVFSVKAYDEVDLIGEGTHKRAVISKEKFKRDLELKKKKLLGEK